MAQTPVTTEEILDAAQERMQLTRAQLLVLVAKSATVRHLATNPDYKDLFVLKGGTLLSNVYRSPRQSIADADYTYLEPANLTVPKLEEALAIDGNYGFYLRPEDGRMTTANDLFETRSPFSMEGIQMSRRARDNELKVTVSVRAGEWLDRTREILVYYDALLASDQSFVVQGLTRDELAAEKLLGWVQQAAVQALRRPGLPRPRASGAHRPRARRRADHPQVRHRRPGAAIPQRRDPPPRRPGEPIRRPRPSSTSYGPTGSASPTPSCCCSRKSVPSPRRSRCSTWPMSSARPSSSGSRPWSAWAEPTSAPSLCLLPGPNQRT